jgi:phosphatidylserine/phosphatidylglycerophosphate/cardiolipin synthase-like enzyme
VGNDVRRLVHSATYFAELMARVSAMEAGDLLLFTDWRGDPDQHLDGPGTEVARVLCRAASRDVVVRGLLWRSHLDRFQFSEQENRSLGHAVIPRFPDQDGRISTPPNLVGRADALALLRAAGGSRVAVYSLENSAGTPIYAHAKVCIVDDTWTIIGSDNFNRRSWTHDFEVSCAILDGDGSFARRLRQALGAEHLGGTASQDQAQTAAASQDQNRTAAAQNQAEAVQSARTRPKRPRPATPECSRHSGGPRRRSMRGNAGGRRGPRPGADRLWRD